MIFSLVFGIVLFIGGGIFTGYEILKENYLLVALGLSVVFLASFFLMVRKIIKTLIELDNRNILALNEIIKGLSE